MRTVNISLTAGVAKKVSVTGFYLTLIQAVAAIDMEVEMVGKAGSSDVSTGLPEGYGEQFPEMFNSVTLTSAVTQDIKIGYSLGVVNFDRTSIISQQASTITNAAPVTVGVAAGLAVAAASTRQRIVFTADDANTGDIYIGGTGITTAAGAIKLEPGASWVEERAAAAAWYAIATAAAQSLRIQTAA
jgi:hypothetical protein